MSKPHPKADPSHPAKPHKEHSHHWKVRHGEALPLWNIIILIALALVVLAFLVVMVYQWI